MALHDSGGYASNIGRPQGEIFIPPSYGVSFFDKMIDTPLTAVGLTSEVPALFSYTEELGDANLEYSRVLHFNVTDASTGVTVQDELYVPYIDSTTVSGKKTIFTTKPLVEVVNPRFVNMAPNLFVMYFFSNFTSASLPDGNIYNDDPQYLRRMVEFSTNQPDQLDGNIPFGLSAPYPNDRNYYVNNPPIDETPRTAFLSCLIRVFPAESNSSEKTYIIAEKPFIITWIGHRFSLDNHPPLLVNKTQLVEWALDKTTSDSLDDDAVNDSPPRQVPYHHVISRINTVMYAGYSGINFYTQPIINLYDLALDHYFEVEGVASKSFDMYSHGRKLTSIGIQQRDETSLGSSDFSPFERHFAVVQIDMDDFRHYSSSSTAIPPSYNVDIPTSVNIMGNDKPDFWSNYWDECSPISYGSITVDFKSDGTWYGDGCIGGIQMYAKLEERPYGYYNTARAKFWLTFGPLTSLDEELDIVWQGYNVDGVIGNGSYNRYYSLGDNTPNTITVTKA